MFITISYSTTWCGQMFCLFWPKAANCHILEAGTIKQLTSLLQKLFQRLIIKKLQIQICKPHYIKIFGILFMWSNTKDWCGWMKETGTVNAEFYTDFNKKCLCLIWNQSHRGWYGSSVPDWFNPAHFDCNNYTTYFLFIGFDSLQLWWLLSIQI